MKETTSRQGFRPWRDAPSVVWLLLVFLVSLGHPFIPHSRWLMVHLVVLGALTHAAMVWSTHFTQALLKTAPTLDGPQIQQRRAMLLAAGVSLVLLGVTFERWQVTLVGAIAVSAAIVWHGIQLWRRLRASIGGRFRITVRYYLVAAAWVPVGATFGVLLARGPTDEWRGRLILAHTAALVLGWIGTTVTGTLITLWPTMLRSRMDDRAESLARQALPFFAIATAGIVIAALTGQSRLAGAAVLTWLLVGLWWGRALLQPAKRRPPRDFATLSVTAALAWAVILLGWVGVALLRGAVWGEVAETHGQATAIVAVGFAPQLLLGALSYLVPVVLGGGPAAVRGAILVLSRYAIPRLTLVNGGLLIALLPGPSVVRVLVTTLVLVALASFLPLLTLAIRTSLRARRSPVEPALVDNGRRGPNPTGGVQWSHRQFIGSVAALGLAVAIGIAADPLAAGIPARDNTAISANAAVAATGQTTTVKVIAKDMRFIPNSVTVPAGNRLVIELTNADPENTHDLMLATGATTPRLRPGASATLDAGVVGVALDGWCTVVGHRQMGMTFTVNVTGGAAAAGAPHTGHESNGTATHTPLALHALTGTTQQTVDPVLAPAPAATEHRITLTVKEVELEVAPGVWQKRWTYNGQVPGPTLRGKVGDVFVITLVNDGSIGHSIDFHAGSLAPDRPMRTIAPGESLTYRFTATHSGIWMYHCSSMPMSAHIAAGMHGVVIIDPPNLPKVDREYVLVQSEVFLGPNRTKGSSSEVDADRVMAELPDAVVFNGIANQYDRAPLTAKVGERVRIWVLDVGPNRATSFHVVGGQFDTVHAEGRYLLQPSGTGAATGAAQTLGLQAAQGGFVEFVPTEAGHYPFVTHVMVDAERGAHGVLTVSK